jgi:hypothetical protein
LIGGDKEKPGMNVSIWFYQFDLDKGVYVFWPSNRGIKERGTAYEN